MGRKKGRPRQQGERAKRINQHFLRPTEAREVKNTFRSAGAAVKVIPPIETLYEAGKLNERQFSALARYADVATAAERSEIKSSIDFSVYGTGDGLPHFGVRMNIELGRLDRALGSLRDIARAVCVMEQTISEWAINRGGSVMRERKLRGQKVQRWYEPRRSVLEQSLLEIRAAGTRIADAIGI